MVTTRRRYIDRDCVVRTVEVHIRSERRQCIHQFRRRPIDDVQSDWQSVCRLCGAIARGAR